MGESGEERARRRQQRLTKPPGSLGRLEELALRLASLQGRECPESRPAHALLFVADHPVARHGVSAYPVAVTAAMVSNLAAGRAASTVLARQHDVPLEIVDVGVDSPYALPDAPARAFPVRRHPVARRAAGDLRSEDAMEPGVFAAALGAGREAVAALPERARVLVLGEMGIGNTTAAAAVAARLLGVDARSVAGRGTGVDEAGVERKTAVLREALARTEPGADEPSAGLEALRRLGGRDLAALAGAMLAAAERGMAVLVDGFVVSAAALAACKSSPPLRTHLLFAHRSAERGHAAVLAALEAEPLLDLGLRLGEASGALVALPLLDTACRLHAEMATLESAGIPGPGEKRA